MEFLFSTVAAALAAYALALAAMDIARRRRLWLSVVEHEATSSSLPLRLTSWIGARADTLVSRSGLNLKRIERRLISAGFDAPDLAAGFVVLRAIAAVLGAIVACLHFGSHGAIAAFAGALLAWLAVNGSLSRRTRQRRESIERELPNALDLLTLCVEAGSDFAQAISRVAARQGAGPLSAEFHRLDSAIRMGTSRRDALRDMAKRIDVPSVSSLIALLAHADRLGSGVGPVLRAASARMRAQRFSRAEKLGAAAAQKALLPLIFCIMPAAFIVIFGPIFVRVATGGIEALL